MPTQRRTSSEWSMLDADESDWDLPDAAALDEGAGYNPAPPRSLGTRALRNESPSLFNRT